MIDLNKLQKIQEMTRIVANSPEYQVFRTLNRAIRIGNAAKADHEALADKAVEALKPVYEKHSSAE